MAQFKAQIRENESFFETFVYKANGIPVDISDSGVGIYVQFRDAPNSTGNLVLDANLSSGHVEKTGNPGEFTIFISLADLNSLFAPKTDFYFEVVLRTGISPNFHHKSLFLGVLRREGALTVLP